MNSVGWVKCGDVKEWCSLQTVSLGNVNVGGVYIIWHEGNPGRVVRIGQGDIASRLAAHRQDSGIVAYRRHGTLRVTWAEVAAYQRDGVERYLANTWPQIVGHVFPDVAPLPVNSPFGE